MCMKIEYICEGCGEGYADINRAIACEATESTEPTCGVGDIVLAKGGFGWFDGDRRWVSNLSVRGEIAGAGDGSKVVQIAAASPKCPNGNGNCFSDCCTYFFYYVVTHIDKHEHRTRYHLMTRAMQKGYRAGYTYNETHIRPEKVESPSDFLLRSSKGLLGGKARHLL